MKKIFTLIAASALMMIALTACADNSDTSGPGNDNTAGDVAGGETSGFDTAQEIGVISREAGSGTRGAFVELFGVEQKNAAGEKIDRTASFAVISNSTSVAMTTVAGDPYAIAYISLGSLNDTVKAVKIDGVDATVDNIKNSAYAIARPFNIATTGTVSATAQDFIDFILSADGQAVIEDNGYIAVAEAAAYSGGAASGKIVVAGSSSVTPVMEKLKEAYLGLNPGVAIEIQQSDSTAGLTSAIEGICDIGMASRELKASETAAGLTAAVIAMDGIAVIVNNDNPIDSLTKEQVCDIYTGVATAWNQVME